MTPLQILVLAASALVLADQQQVGYSLTVNKDRLNNAANEPQN